MPKNHWLPCGSGACGDRAPDRRVDDCRVDDGAGRDLQPVRLEMVMNFPEQPAAEIMRLEQMPEPADRGLVGRRLAAKIDPGAIAHRGQV